MIGKVKSFSRVKGYGFVNTLGIDDDIFSHFSEIQQEGFKFLKAGDIVDFEYDQKNIQAVKLNKIRGVESGKK